ncbi:hypothetical protein ENSA5_38120 [Enhygromyxa salina]|uniref:Uncharacterized protein n=1 Tax=Enhygromyxa salina TaxID=215803 RepID=A0A2S9XRN7_9BACT|nr:hypothetical protein [Enhygromyxa salina]PRP95529.1 hypothetical protein ENSA5_38120 [Enhygromyxa salina]
MVSPSDVGTQRLADEGPDPRELREIKEILADHVGAVDRPIRE